MDYKQLYLRKVALEQRIRRAQYKIQEMRDELTDIETRIAAEEARFAARAEYRKAFFAEPLGRKRPVSAVPDPENT